MMAQRRQTFSLQIKNFYGFSPDPKPELIAWRATRRPALSLSKGLERDRAVDETGNQIAVFNRLGSRPFTLAEMQRLYLRDGRLYTVAEEPPAPPQGAPPAEKSKEDEPPPAPGPRLRRGGGT